MDLRETICQKLNISTLSPAEQDLVLARLEDAILRETTLQILETLPPTDRAELEETISDQDDETVLGFIRSKLGDFENFQKQVAQEVIHKFLA